MPSQPFFIYNLSVSFFSALKSQGLDLYTRGYIVRKWPVGLTILDMSHSQLLSLHVRVHSSTRR
jgi:hypothetical protein